MIKIFKEVDKKLETKEVSKDELKTAVTYNSWIHLVGPTLDEISELSSITHIPQDKLQSALDEEETAHLDIDEDITLLVMDIPITENGFYATLPFAMIYNGDYFITICTREASVVTGLLQKFKKIEPHKHVRLSLQIMYRIASMYITSLKIVDLQSKHVQSELQSSMRNKELFDLMELNKSLVYFSTSLNANKIALSKLNRLAEYKKYEEDFDLMEDVNIENSQAIEMCSIYRDILAGMMDAFASIISNNLNIVMKALAVVTLVISIPTLVASLFGMNVDVPFAKNEWGFYIIIAISIVLSFVGAYILMRYTKKVRKH